MGFVVAVDGPAGSGKGTITKIVAERLNLTTVDTGAMYRSVALECLNKNIKPTEIEKINEILKDIQIDLKRENGKQKVYLNGQDVTEKIRSKEVDDCVAKFAAIKEIRDKVTPIQRQMGENQNIIMEGRDIGTVVFPNADVKIYLDATPEERARRRLNQNRQKGMMDETYEQILESVKNRDYIDSHREVAPLKQAEDAIYIDSSNMTVEEVVSKIIQIIQEKKKQ